MLVRVLAGRNYGEVVDMPFPIARRAIRSGTAEEITESAGVGDGAPPDAPDADVPVATVSAAGTKEKRRWRKP